MILWYPTFNQVGFVLDANLFMTIQYKSIYYYENYYNRSYSQGSDQMVGTNDLLCISHKSFSCTKAQVLTVMTEYYF